MRKTLKGVALTAVGVLCIGVGSASAAEVDVTQNDVAKQPENTPPTKNWVTYTRNAGDANFRFGPGSPPLGAGSLESVTPTGADKVTTFNFDHVGDPLSGINAMGYSTYRSAGNDQQVAAINLQVDSNGAAPGGFTTLVFEPVYNTGQGAVVSGQWQNWDAYQGGNAIWWSSNPINGAPNRDTFVPWSTIVAQNPNAVVVGGYGINQGSGNPTLISSADALTYNTTTYDFEVAPTSKDQCKNGGWQNYGGMFKNQGDCVSSVASKNK